VSDGREKSDGFARTHLTIYSDAEVTMRERFLTKVFGGLLLVGLNCIFLLMTGQEYKSSFIWMGLIGILFMVGLLFPVFQVRAYGFLFLTSGMLYVGFLSYLDLALQLMLGKYWESNLGLVSLTLLVCNILLLLQVNIMQGKAQKGKKYLIETKKLDIQAAEWDFDIFLRLEDPEKHEKKMAWVLRLRYLLPFGPAVGFYLNRHFAVNRANFIIGLLVFVVAILCLLQVGLQIALGIKIREWEKEMGIQIRGKE
jgi:hypothetical protein